MPLKLNDPRIAGRQPPLYPQAPKQQITFDSLVGKGVFGDVVTTPGPRPRTFQSALNFQITLAANIATQLTSGQIEVDCIVVNVASSVGNSVFFGFGSQITPSSGIEVRPGLPLTISADTQREQWELQRLLEILVAYVTNSSPGPYKAPRNVFDASQYYVVATVATTIAVMLFPPNDN